MRYLQDEGFSVNMGGSKEYRDNWENIFMKKSGSKKRAAKKQSDGLFLVLDGTISLVDRQGGKVISNEPIEGKVVLKLILHALERALDERVWPGEGAK